MSFNEREGGEYFDYLRRRSITGLIYRKYWLYPRLARHLSGRVLDVGCGIGDFLAYRAGTVGVDVNPRTVDWCRQQGLNASVMDPDVLPFADSDFDGVVLDNVLEHLADPVPLLSEIRRVLVQEGCLLIGVPGKKGFASDSDHKVYYDESGLHDIAVKAGFVQQQLFHMPFRNHWLAERLSQYCLYGLFVRA